MSAACRISVEFVSNCRIRVELVPYIRRRRGDGVGLVSMFCLPGERSRQSFTIGWLRHAHHVASPDQAIQRDAFEVDLPGQHRHRQPLVIGHDAAQDREVVVLEEDSDLNNVWTCWCSCMSH